MLNYDKKIHNYIRLETSFSFLIFTQMKTFSLGNLFKMQSIATKQTFLKWVPEIPAFLVCVSSMKTNDTYMSPKMCGSPCHIFYPKQI